MDGAPLDVIGHLVNASEAIQIQNLGNGVAVFDAGCAGTKTKEGTERQSKPVNQREESERMPKPSISRNVHYVARGSADGVFKPECVAAIITSAPTAGRGRPPKKIDLFVMTTTGSHHQSCLQDEDTKAGGTWHWPEHVEDDEPVKVAAKVAKVAKKAPAKSAAVETGV